MIEIWASTSRGWLSVRWMARDGQQCYAPLSTKETLGLLRVMGHECDGVRVMTSGVRASRIHNPRKGNQFRTGSAEKTK